jgi:hypothetical protein
MNYLMNVNMQIRTISRESNSYFFPNLIVSFEINYIYSRVNLNNYYIENKEEIKQTKANMRQPHNKHNQYATNKNQ